MNQQAVFGTDYAANTQNMDTQLRIHESFDLIAREIMVGSKRARLYFIDGFVQDVLMANIMQALMQISEEKLQGFANTRQFADSMVAYVETDIQANVAQFQTAVLSGTVGILVEGFCEAVMVDARTYPARAVGEPENDKVLRGPHEGFVETLLFNTAMIRRRIRDTNLTIGIHQIGEKSKTDVAVCYLNGKAEGKIVDAITQKVQAVQVESLTMGQESLLECLVPGHKFNPYPKVRYTERPDAAAACLYEGNVIIIVDNSPAAMIVPTGFFDFLQDTNDYYFPPFIGSYLRIMRLIIFFLTLFMAPGWYVLVEYPQYLPEWLAFIKVDEPIVLPFVFQFMIIEVVIDALRLASLNTPSALSNSFSVIGALVLGEFAIKAGWFKAEVVLYMAFVAITNFALPSFELGYAFKITRMMLVVLTAIFNLWGFLAGLVIFILLLATNKTITGRCYLYPLIPFNWHALSSLLLRRSIQAKMKPRPKRKKRE